MTSMKHTSAGKTRGVIVHTPDRPGNMLTNEQRRIVQAVHEAAGPILAETVRTMFLDFELPVTTVRAKLKLALEATEQ